MFPEFPFDIRKHKRLYESIVQKCLKGYHNRLE